MAITAHSGPLLAYGIGANANPSTFGYGIARLDARYPYREGQPDTTPIYGWAGCDYHVLVDTIPSAISTTRLAASQTPTANTALTLVSVSGTGVFVLPAGSGIVSALVGSLLTTTPLLSIEAPVATVSYSQLNGIQVYNPYTMLARTVTITSAGNDSAATFLVTGFDLYGFPQTELITGANGTTATGRKGFKYVQSVLPAGTLSGSSVSVGVSDVYQFPLAVTSWPYAEIYYAGVVVTSPTGFTAAVTTSPATSTTGDPRGTYALQSASNGTNRLFIAVAPNPVNFAPTGLTGVTPA